MCGINGIFGLSDKTKAEQAVAKMNSALAHRGPNDEGIFYSPLLWRGVRGEVCLGHRRLSIIDLSSAGHQPMRSNNGRFQVIHNGEIYNFNELKALLSDYSFQSKTDTEIILAAYEKWGEKCVEYFEGMFAFAIWDNQKNELFIARDRLGIKPVYYYKNENYFVFSSEIRALLASGIVPKKVDENSLIDYLRYQTVHAPNTILQEVKMLLPGHFISVSENNFSIKKYWSLEEKINYSSEKKTYREICADVKNLLRNAVKKRLIADVPFGAFLSGGIDSSAIVGLMRETAASKLKTFSVVFDESEFSEAKYSRLIAKKFNTEHCEIKLSASDFLHELPNALRSLDHPSGDGPNSYIVSKATKDAGITMALSGLGGDELFGGYDIFKRGKKLQNLFWLNFIPKILRENVAEIIRNSSPGIASGKIAEILKSPKIDFHSTYHLSRQVLSDEQILKIVNQKSLPKNFVSDFTSGIGHRTSDYLFSQISIAEISTYMQNVLLRDTDQMSMAHALEVRVPFLDHHLIEYVLGIPDKFKNPVSPKKLLVDSLGNLLPAEIVNRPKMGFTFPWQHWLKNELKTFCEEKIKNISQREFFNENEVVHLWNEFLNGNPKVTWSRIWILAVLENWLEENNL